MIEPMPFDIYKKHFAEILDLILATMERNFREEDLRVLSFVFEPLNNVLATQRELMSAKIP